MASVFPSSVVDRGFERRSDQTKNGNRISDAVVSVLSFSAVDRVFERRSGQTKNGNRISDVLVSVPPRVR